MAAPANLPRLERYDDTVLYLRLSDHAWARSSFPEEGITVDYDTDEHVIGVEIVTQPMPQSYGAGSAY